MPKTNPFVPTLWSAVGETQIQNNMVEYMMVNTNWEGEIREKGSTVKILAPGDVTVKTLPPNRVLDDPEEPNDDERILVIDQEKYFNFGVDDVEQVQSAVKNKMAMYMQSGLKGVRKVAGGFILSQYVNVHANNIITPNVEIDETNIHKYFQMMTEKFETVSDDDPEDRRVVISPAIQTCIALFFAGKNTDFGTKITTEGHPNRGSIGKFMGWNCFPSNRTPIVEEDINSDTEPESVHKILFGVPSGITFAFQLPPEKLEKYRPEKKFQDAVKGLALYGGEMLYQGKRNGLLNAYFKK